MSMFELDQAFNATRRFSFCEDSLQQVPGVTPVVELKQRQRPRKVRLFLWTQSQ